MSEPTVTPAKRSTRPEKEPTPAPPEKAGFPYEQYLEDRDGTPYLPLRWRLAWLRSAQPQARITTRLVSHDKGVAIFRALVQLPGGASATGWGARSQAEGASEGFEDGSSLDYIVYAENQALSRALAALGYGTQYALDFDPPADHPTILLPEAGETQADDEPGILVPLPRPDRPVATPVAVVKSQGEAADDDGDEAEGDEPPAPRPLSPVRGEVRNIAERRPAFNSRPDTEPADDDDDGDEPAQPTPRPFARPTERPAETTPAPTFTPSTPNAAVEDRVKFVRDDGLRALIKRIYFEARQRFEYDEDTVDKRSLARYEKRTFELDSEEAEKYLEVIVTASNRRQR